MHFTASFTSPRSYLLSWQGKIIARYELLKRSAVARLKSVYFGAKSMSEAQAVAKMVNRLFQLSTIIRPSERTCLPYEVVIRGVRVGQAAAIERFLATFIGASVAAPGSPIPHFTAPVPVFAAVGNAPKVKPVIHRPDLPDRAVAVGSDGRVLNIA